MPDTLFRHGALLLPDAAVLEDGWLRVRDDKIAAYGAGEVVPSPADAVVELGGNLLMPGLINAHTHAAMTLFRGLADDLPLMDWLNNYIFPAEKNLTAEWVKWGTLLACLEMMRGGTTTFADMYLFIDTAAAAAEASGLRAVVGEALYDFPSPHYGAAANGLKFTRDFIQRWREHPTVHPVVNAHSAYTCSPALLQAANEIAAEYDVLLHLHVAENEAEVAQVAGRYGARPLKHLANLGLATPRLLAAHMVHLDDEEMELTAANGVRVAHNPVSNLKLVSGVARAPEMLRRGVAVGLGTDGCASNNNLDMFNTMKTAACLHKWDSRDATALSAAQTLALATDARCLRLEKITGKIAVGLAADLVVVDFSAPNMRPCYDRAAQLVYAATPHNVRDVMVHGKWLLRDRRVLTIDENEVYANVEIIAEKIRRAVGKSN
ncbi:MAG: amidohydrolase [Planctomycetota bacterium]|jgi:5-methylthioadenosine/S-adenosylhomocysteine deaminase|nr:amidohydrolase [Planctomycetota bacterium]